MSSTILFYFENVDIEVSQRALKSCVSAVCIFTWFCHRTIEPKVRTSQISFQLGQTLHANRLI